MATTAGPERARPAPWREVLRGRRGRLTGGLLLLEAMVGIEVLIVTTILPAVERDLGGLQLYGWAFSAYGLATLLTVPLGGRATDRFGPRPVLGIALGAFALGLLIASVAPSMEVVVLGRFVQGCGGGALYVVSVAAIAKAYPEALRPRVFALLTSMWILPGVIGPPLGALRAARGLPATAAAAFLTSASFAAIDGFVPLMLTRVRGLSVGQAGLVVTGATITWCAGTFWQSRRFEDMGAQKLVRIGGL